MCEKLLDLRHNISKINTTFYFFYEEFMKKDNLKWILTITISAFLITIVFSLGSQILLEDVGVIIGIIIILIFILIGVLFDIIGVAVQSSEVQPFHAMASKKIKGAKTAKKMLKNSAKVSSFCNDVIGDICNIISGSAGLVVSNNISNSFNIDVTVSTLMVTSIIAALTIGGKALGKGVAVSKSEFIISKVIKILHKFERKK